MKVRNMISSMGNPIANQFKILNKNKIYFQSYDSIIVERIFLDSGTVTKLDRDAWDYSKTTGKYRNIFLGETKAETLRKIDSGEYKLTNLNK